MSFSCPKKEIVYRGGVVRFFIPKHWIEEYEPDGGGMFYEAGEDTGTLRLNVLSFLTKEDASPDYRWALVKRRSREYEGHAEALSDHRFLSKYSMKDKEDGEDINILFWRVSKMVSPRDFNIAAFSYTISDAQSQSKSVIEEIASIEEEIKEVRFGLHGDSYEP